MTRDALSIQGRRQDLLVGGLNARRARREIFEATPTSGKTLYHARFHSMRTHVFGFRYHVHNKWLVSKTESRNQETRSTRSGEPSVHDLVSKNKTQHHCQPFTYTR